MNNKNRSTLAQIFQDPVRADIAWRDIESLFTALGAEITEGRGSRVQVLLKDVVGHFHRPHPEKETDKGAVKSVRRYLLTAGVEP